jgi:hypothetical protein
MPRCVASLVAIRQDESARGISEAAHAATLTLRLAIAAFAFLAGAALCVATMMNPPETVNGPVSPSQIAVGVAAALAGIVASVLVLTGRLSVGTSARVETILKHGHCPSCLAAFDVGDEDGIATCPKCRARWRCLWVVPRGVAAGAAVTVKE